ncbi:endonuclease/exonuclease/phosphatase family protein [Spartinivicinus ruber]|uniref:endonuclease/exonuclease/phosphatase family protein n=1 Tax=Spartinivicinus ruber TaxID=2683272 RepID=UPI0013D73345|nr:endonuclease/exonuclease/phosphatase family protein [Spartinivicinus ruber]
MVVWLLKRILLVILLAGFASGIGWFGEHHWLADLANHFRWYYLIAALLGIVLFSFARKWIWVSIALLVVMLNYPVVSLYGLPKSVATLAFSQKAITVVQVNVNLNNDDTLTLLQWLQQEQPDVVAVEEFTPAWAEAFKQLHSLYPYHLEEPRNGGFGIALFSRYPIENFQTLYFGPDKLPSISGMLNWNQKKVQLVATHPLPPISRTKAISRDLQLAELASWLKHQQKPAILLGDLNTTPWGHSFYKLINTADLFSAREGFGMLPTWPGVIPLIPIDHILLSKDLKTISVKQGPDIGSDHLPVIAEVVL